MAREPDAIAELRRDLGSRLATFRLAAGLTQGKLATVAFCDRTTIVHIEKGRARADERFWRSVDDACSAAGVLYAAFVELEAAKAEHERQVRDRRLAGVRARAAELRGGLASGTGATPQADVPQLEGLRRALLGHHAEHTPRPAQVEAGVTQAHQLYQRAEYDGAARLLPAVIQATATTAVPVQIKATAYLAAAKLATKVGDSSLAWVAADRCVWLAEETDRPALIGIAKYQVACALLGSGHLADAEQTAALALEDVARHAESAQPDAVSVRGALVLLMAVIAARRGAAQSARQCLTEARSVAERLGQDGNWLWTAFGPTNVAIHELAVLVALGDWRACLQLGERVDTDNLPMVLRGRRAQVHLELGWAAAGQGDDSLAVLHALEAERVAQQAVRRNATARTLLNTLLARERQSATPGLRALALRAGVAR